MALFEAAEEAPLKKEFERVSDALFDYVTNYGTIDLYDMSQKYNIPIMDIITDPDLKKVIIQNPAKLDFNENYDITKGWEMTSTYLSSSRHESLKLAHEANTRYSGKFSKNIELLNENLPNYTAEDISFQLGAPWIGEDIHEQFVNHIFKFSSPARVSLSEETFKWSIIPPRDGSYSVTNRTVWGVMRREGKAFISAMLGTKILENAMNGKDSKIYIPGEKKLDANLTLDALERAEKLAAAFDKFIRENDSICNRLTIRYNHMLSERRPVSYDGSFLKFPYLDPSVNLYRSQKDAIARIILSPNNVLVNHSVGAGKGYIAAIGCYELYRLNKSKRNMIAVPNNMVKTMEENFALIPNCKVFTIHPSDFTPVKRRKTLQKAIDGDYVAIIIPFSCFDMLKMSKSYRIDSMNKTIYRIRSAIGRAKSTYERRLLESEENKLSGKLSKFVSSYQDPDWQAFDELNITTLFIDEAHLYKNIDIAVHGIENIVGMHTQGSQKCNNCLMKVHSVKRAVFTTATPITNSLSDLFVMQTYLQPEDLYLYKLTSFNSWITSFATKSSGVEFDVTNNPRYMTRYTKFINLPELMTIFSNICDFYQMEADGVPDAVCEDVTVPLSPLQRDFMDTLSERADLVRSSRVSKNQDNFLKITVHGRECATDLRLIDPTLPVNPSETKAAYCAEKISALYKKHPDKAQVVFCDMGTPKPGFNVYDTLKSECVKRGIPEKSIAFVHSATTDSALKKLFDDVNTAKVSVIIGSSSKLGTGVNIQSRLIGLHHLDVPWRPAEMVQRAGRALRPGNTNSVVYVYRYLTPGTFDSYSWQLLENKQRAISSFFAGYASSHLMEDAAAEAVLTYSEIKALCIGNKNFKLRFETANLLDRAKIAASQREKQLRTLKSFISSTPERLSELDRAINDIYKDIEHLNKNKEGSIPNEERISLGEELLDALKENAFYPNARMFDIYNGFDIIFPEDMNPLAPYIYIQGISGKKYYIDMATDKPLGVTKRIDIALDSLASRAEKLLTQKDALIEELRTAKEDYSHGNEYTERCKELSEALVRIDAELNLGGNKNDNND